VAFSFEGTHNLLQIPNNPNPEALLK